MPRVGDLHTSKTFFESLQELRSIFRKWDVKDYILPTSKGAAQAGGGVTLEFVIKDRWISLQCSKFKWGADAPARNLRALVMAIDAARLAEQRGIGEIFAKLATELYALPAPKTPPSSGARPGASTAYDILGVSVSASKGVLLAAYRARVKEAHPDAPGGDPAEFRRLQEAARELGIINEQGTTII